jgi:hypothetical protein
MKDQHSKFYSEQIQVVCDQKPGIPSAFIWRGKRYDIQEIWGEWPDYGFGATSTGRWWQRRHRTYFRVVTDREEVFEIYLDRASHQRQWFLYRRLDETLDGQDSSG